MGSRQDVALATIRFIVHKVVEHGNEGEEARNTGYVLSKHAEKDQRHHHSDVGEGTSSTQIG